MKKLLIPLLFLLASCGDDTVSVPKAEYDQLKALAPKPVKPEYPRSIQSPKLYNSDIYDPWVVTIQDSCEYIYTYTIWSNGGPIYTHKGNCKFCEKRMDKRFEDLYNRLKK